MTKKSNEKNCSECSQEKNYNKIWENCTTMIAEMDFKPSKNDQNNYYMGKNKNNGK